MVNFPDDVLVKTNHDVLVEFAKNMFVLLKIWKNSAAYGHSLTLSSQAERCQVSDGFLSFLPPSDP